MCCLCVNVYCHRVTTQSLLIKYIIYHLLDVHGSVRHTINRTEITNKVQQCTRIYYSNVY